MSSVTHLTQHLLKLDPGKNVARQTLFNYLKVFVSSGAQLNAEILNQFFAYVLNYQYWQANTKNLGQSVQADLETFAQSFRLDFEMSQVHFPHLTQLVILEQTRDVEQLINTLERSRREDGDRGKLMAISDQQMLAATLKSNGALIVRVYGRAAQIVGGALQLIRPLTELQYTSQLELDKQVVQLLEGPMVTAARFNLNDDGCQGVMVRGHMLQRYETLSAGGLAQHAELFYGLKRIERFFINPTSDPYHRELVGGLERAYQLLQNGHPDGKRMANGALQRGKAALKHIFPNDKLLMVLVTNIEFALISPQPSAPQPEPWERQLKP
ncbi:MAG: hypothetical protein AB7N80_05115 [Bdellovibrionales bacterium]